MHAMASAAAIGLLLPLLAAVGATTPARGAVSCDGRAATIVVPLPAPGSYGSSPLTGSPGDDVIVGTELPDMIDGAGGNDVICGLAGDDVIIGGDGNDRLFGGLDGEYLMDEDYWGDLVAPGAGDDYVDLGHDPQGEDLDAVDRGFWDRVSFRHASGPVKVDLMAGTATGEGTDTIAPVVHAAGIQGSAHADILLGTDHDDWITAGGGDDTIDARGGSDLVDADRLDRPVTPDDPSLGDDVVEGGRGRDVIIAGHGADEVFGGPGDDEIWLVDGAGARADGGPGRDNFIGSGRADLRGGKHDDLLDVRVRAASDRLVVTGGTGRDVVKLDILPSLTPADSRLVIGKPSGTVLLPSGTPVTRYGSVENVRLEWVDRAVAVDWYGTPRADVLRLSAQVGRVRAFGRGGPDRLLGGSADDLLDGGPGRDWLVGGGGRDRCLRGERLTSCEVTR